MTHLCFMKDTDLFELSTFFPCSRLRFDLFSLSTLSLIYKFSSILYHLFLMFKFPPTFPKFSVFWIFKSPHFFPLTHPSAPSAYDSSRAAPAACDGWASARRSGWSPRPQESGASRSLEDENMGKNHGNNHGNKLSHVGICKVEIDDIRTYPNYRL